MSFDGCGVKLSNPTCYSIIIYFTKYNKDGSIEDEDIIKMKIIK